MMSDKKFIIAELLNDIKTIINTDNSKDINNNTNDIKNNSDDLKTSNDDIKNILDATVGNLGGIYSGAAVIAPDAGYVFNCIYIVADAVITAVGNVTGITGITFTTNTCIYGRFTSVTVTSGAVVAYQGV